MLTFTSVKKTSKVSRKGGYFMEDFLKVVVVVGLGLWAVSAISRQPWCGQNCRVILQDARGTLIQDLVTGALAWV